MLLSAGLHQIRPRLMEWLQSPPALSVPVQWDTVSPDQPRVFTSGVLICEPESKSQGRRLLSYLQIATGWLPNSF
jgi:hypothetical protein